VAALNFGLPQSVPHDNNSLNVFVFPDDRVNIELTQRLGTSFFLCYVFRLEIFVIVIVFTEHYYGFGLFEKLQVCVLWTVQVLWSRCCAGGKSGLVS
jgi:hypothetical protein